VRVSDRAVRMPEPLGDLQDVAVLEHARGEGVAEQIERGSIADRNASLGGCGVEDAPPDVVLMRGVPLAVAKTGASPPRPRVYARNSSASQKGIGRSRRPASVFGGW
jgi:hypothetical protein